MGEILTRGDFRQSVLTRPERLKGIDQGFLQDFRGLLLLRASDGASFAPRGPGFGKRKGSLSTVSMVPNPNKGSAPKKTYWTARATHRYPPKIQRAKPS